MTPQKLRTNLDIPSYGFFIKWIISEQLYCTIIDNISSCFAEEAINEKIATQSIDNEFHDADEANLLEEEGCFSYFL